MTSPAKDEEQWRALERLDQGVPASTPEEAKLRAPYEKLVERLQRADAGLDAPAGWEERLGARWEAEERKRKRRWMLGVGAGGAVAGPAVLAAMLVLRAGVAAVPALEMVALKGAEQLRGEAATGETLQVRVRAGSTVMLLLYREQEQVARCPGSDGCRPEGDLLILEFPLRRDGTYTALRVEGKSGPVELSRGRLADHLLEVRRLERRRLAEFERSELEVSP